MKITIKKFMELSNVSFETPIKIEAGHDVGKSTIFRAVLFAIIGKDVNGAEFDGKIYPKNSTSLSDLNVEVEIEQSGTVFNKKATGSEKRQKGSDETELQRSVTSIYSIDFRVVGKAEYDAKILEVFGNFQLFCNPDYFRNLKTTDEKRKIFLPLVNIDKSTYFDGLMDKKMTKGRRDKQQEEIDQTNAGIKELLLVKEPLKIEVVDYDSQLSELRKQRQDAEPKFTKEQICKNDEINHEISNIENSVFIPESLIPFLPEIEKPVLIDIDDLQKKLEGVQLSNPNTYFLDTQTLRINEKITKIRSLQLQVENYDENVKNSKCTLCQVCAAPDCQFKRVEITPLDELQNELSKLMPLKDAEKSLENLESQKIDYLRDFEQKKESEILRLEFEIRDAEETNNDDYETYDRERLEIETKNAEISEKNKWTILNNAKSLANFETDKAQKIAELKKQLHTLPAFDYSEIDERIRNLELLKGSQQIHINDYNEVNGAWIFATNRTVVLQNDLQQMKSALYASERELIKIEDAENRYYYDFENLINAEMPENIRVSLFKKNLSNDNYSEVFDIEFNGSIYAGNGKTIAFYIWLCGWFQSKFEKNLPIFIDEAIILNEKLYSDVKNVVILMRNDNCKTLKISEL